MSSSAVPSSIPEPVRAVLDLFAGPLTDVAFPDVDRASLGAAAAEVEARRKELQAALDAVQVAREGLEAEQAQLLALSRRAHAYAKVYAGDEGELADAIAAIKLDGRSFAPRKKRSRSRKSKADKKKQQTSLAVASDAA